MIYHHTGPAMHQFFLYYADAFAIALLFAVKCCMAAKHGDRLSGECDE